MGFDNKVITSAIISMAVKGYIKIMEEGDEFSLKCLGKNRDKLSEDETILADKFFRTKLSNQSIKVIEVLSTGGALNIDKNKIESYLNAGLNDTFRFNTPGGITLNSAINKVKRSLNEDYDGVYFKHNYNFMIFPVCMFFLMMLIIVINRGTTEMAIFISVWLGVWTAGVAGMVAQIINLLKSPGTSGRNTSLVAISLFSAPFFIGEIFGIGIFIYVVGLNGLVALLTTPVLLLLYKKVIKIRTPLGVEAQSRIVGLKRFLTATESGRYASDIHKEIPHTLKIYEKYLPYAVALDVEPIWAERFKDIIDKTMSKIEINRSGSIYVGSTPVSLDVSLHNIYSIGALTASIVTASSLSRPGSSSGFGGGSSGGGGGGSGGGGGGGGGGGW